MNKKYRGIKNCSVMETSDNLRDKLIGFANLGVHSIGSEGICFRAKERSSRKVYAIKIPKNCAGMSVEHQCSSTQPSCTIREMAMLHKLSSATNEGQRYLCLAKAVDPTGRNQDAGISCCHWTRQ
mmetsp:Transcript_16584/g.21044  ORF Transcript_16584/g.21044 Transcript_16584/m.21044 type:complete len:125 (-) Transcript_16584:303-677(-)